MQFPSAHFAIPSLKGVRCVQRVLARILVDAEGFLAVGWTD